MGGSGRTHIAAMAKGQQIVCRRCTAAPEIWRCDPHSSIEACPAAVFWPAERTKRRTLLQFAALVTSGYCHCARANDDARGTHQLVLRPEAVRNVGHLDEAVL